MFCKKFIGFRDSNESARLQGENGAATMFAKGEVKASNGATAS